MKFGMHIMAPEHISTTYFINPSHNSEVKDEMDRACSMNGEKRNAYRILVGKSEGKRPLRRPRRKWVGNIKMDLKRDRVGWYGLDWSDMVMNLRVP
jgi:hypothetical protein